jgi:hypothetical protein
MKNYISTYSFGDRNCTNGRFNTLQAAVILGKHKARVFSSMLDLDRKDAGLLKNKVLNVVQSAEPVTEFEDEYGIRYLKLNLPMRKVYQKRSYWFQKKI